MTDLPTCPRQARVPSVWPVEEPARRDHAKTSVRADHSTGALHKFASCGSCDREGDAEKIFSLIFDSPPLDCRHGALQSRGTTLLHTVAAFSAGVLVVSFSHLPLDHDLASSIVSDPSPRFFCPFARRCRTWYAYVLYTSLLRRTLFVLASGVIPATLWLRSGPYT